MILVISAVGDNQLEVWLTNGANFYYKKVSNLRHSSDRIVISIGQLLVKHKVTVKKLQAVGVVTGPGRFSAVRLSVAIANALAFAWQIPVVGVSLDNVEEGVEVNQVVTQKIFKQLASKKKLPRVAVPVYDGQPNITI
jgi:tRNA A37 threonylcarbamoyladenosine modification protein TsaB